MTILILMEKKISYQAKLMKHQRCEPSAPMAPISLHTTEPLASATMILYNISVLYATAQANQHFHTCFNSSVIRAQRVGAGGQLEDAREGLVQKNSQVKGAW